MNKCLMRYECIICVIAVQTESESSNGFAEPVGKDGSRDIHATLVANIELSYLSGYIKPSYTFTEADGVYKLKVTCQTHPNHMTSHSLTVTCRLESLLHFINRMHVHD